jgi:hypothetical protein
MTTRIMVVMKVFIWLESQDFTPLKVKCFAEHDPKDREKHCTLILMDMWGASGHLWMCLVYNEDNPCSQFI